MIFRFSRTLSRSVHSLPQYKMVAKTAAFGALAAVLWMYWELSLPVVLLVVFGIYLATGGWKFTKVVIKTFPRDFRALLFLIHVKRLMKKYTKSNYNIPKLFQDTVRRTPNKVAFIFEGRHWTFREVDEYSNAVANYFSETGFRAGDKIAIFMENSPEYVCLWLGLAKVGIVPALINYNLRMKAMAHCINIAEAKALIFQSEFAEAISEGRSMLNNGTRMYCFGENSDKVQPATHLNPLLAKCSQLPPPLYTAGFNDKLFYIYTSGTTGLPKAAIVIHSRFFYMAYSVHNFFHMKKTDIIYDTLPLYHTAGGVLGIGQALIQGCTVVLRRKFSASRFWDDCVQYNCTVVQYIGEIARYLLAQPYRPAEKQNKVRCAFGNGLRPQIWEQFKERYGIDWIGEFYGATEGNANIVNTDNTVGAVGFTTRLAPALYPVTLIKIDEKTGDLVRDRNGLCVKAEPGEPGELVGKIIKGDPLREFDGYVNKSATSKKIAGDVFSKGDFAFLTGDVLVMDEYGYMFFRDRTGDTFRWRGENVSTAEVEATVSNIIKLKDSTVYGVEVPGLEGRAGMAAIVDEEGSVDLKALYRDLLKALPAYARPVFIRIMDKLDTTGTFKLKKVELRKEGFNPSLVKDKMYYLDAKAGEYKPITKEVYDSIVAGKIRI